MNRKPMYYIRQNESRRGKRRRQERSDTEESEGRLSLKAQGTFQVSWVGRKAQRP